MTARTEFEVIDRMENYLYDVRVRATMPGGIDERVVIVDTLFDDYGIRTLGFDVLFAEAERGDGNDAFAESFIARDVITGFVFKDSLSEGEPEFTGALPAALIPGADLEGFSVPFVDAAGYTGNLPALQEIAAICTQRSHWQ